MNRQGLVRRQGPGGGGPGEERGVGKRRVLRQRLFCRASLARALHWEGNRQGRILAHLIGIVQAGLLIGQRSVLRPRVRQDAEALVDQALVIKLLERPHDGFHVVDIHGLVAVFKVHPAGLAVDVLFPLVGVLQHGLGAVFIELFQAHVLDLRLFSDTQLLFRLQLGGQTVGIPTEDTRHVIASHRAIARDDILHITGQQVAIVRQAICEWRAIIKDVLWAVLGLF